MTPTGLGKSASQVSRVFQSLIYFIYFITGFDDFCSILQGLLYNKLLYKDTFGKYSTDGKRVTLAAFKDFLVKEQKDNINPDEISEKMRNFLQDPSRDVDEPYFTISEFLDWLFSKDNQLLDEKTSKSVTQDMTKPLSHYWISSSHNTYLTGDQIQSESSVEAYSRCLRMGCRSVELDCWDGPEGSTGGPLIYHGHTLTTKIKFRDVVEAIKVRNSNQANHATSYCIYRSTPLSRRTIL